MDEGRRMLPLTRRSFLTRRFEIVGGVEACCMYGINRIESHLLCEENMKRKAARKKQESIRKTGRFFVPYAVIVIKTAEEKHGGMAGVGVVRN
jgi:hypothetical protein